MASVKLNQWSRDRIRSRMIQHRFASTIEDLTSRYKGFVNDVYNDVYSLSDRTKMAKLPSGWLPKKGKLPMKLGSGSSAFTHLHFDGTNLSYELDKVNQGVTESEERLLASSHVANAARVYDANHHFTEEYQAFSKEADGIVSDVKAATAKINSALGSVTTVGALLKAWPEAKPFIGDVAVVVNTLPSIPVARLNEILDLPVEEQAA